MNQWVGLKFKVNTVPDTSDVQLELWVDYNNDGQWELGLSYTDTLGDWPCSTSKVVPTECSQNNGDTVTRPGNVSFLRTDGEDTTTEVHWRDVTITNSVTQKPLCYDGIEGSNGGTEVCCASSCGQCGGSGCSSLPGGSSLCCTGTIVTNGIECQDSSDVGCIISSPTTTTVASTTTQATTTTSAVTTVDKYFCGCEGEQYCDENIYPTWLDSCPPICNGGCGKGVSKSCQSVTCQASGPNPSTTAATPPPPSSTPPSCDCSQYTDRNPCKNGCGGSNGSVCSWGGNPKSCRTA